MISCCRMTRASRSSRVSLSSCSVVSVIIAARMIAKFQKTCEQLRSTDLATTINQAGVSNYYTSGAVGTAKEIGVYRSGRYVRVQLAGDNILSLAEAEVRGGPNGNLSLVKPATQSSTAYDAPASRGVDGNTSGNWANNSVTHTATEHQPWWQVDLGSIQQIEVVKLWNRTDCCSDRLSNFYVLDSNDPFSSTVIDHGLDG